MKYRATILVLILLPILVGGYHFNSQRDVGYGTMTSSKRPGVAEARVALNEAIGATTTSTARRQL